MYSVIASIKSTAPAHLPVCAENAPPRFPAADFLKMLAAALACGLSAGALAAAVAMLLAQIGA